MSVTVNICINLRKKRFNYDIVINLEKGRDILKQSNVHNNGILLNVTNFSLITYTARAHVCMYIYIYYYSYNKLLLTFANCLFKMHFYTEETCYNHVT